MMVKIQKGFPFTPKAYIPLNAGLVAICDPKWHKQLSNLHWYAKKSACCWYVCAKVRIENGWKFLRMHRVVAHTPDGMVPHHINGNSFDNREANLQNMTPYEHAKYYSYW